MSTSIDSVTSNRTVHIRGMRGGVVAIDTTAPYGIACINVDRAELIAAIETELDVIVIARTDLPGVKIVANHGIRAKDTDR